MLDQNHIDLGSISLKDTDEESQSTPSGADRQQIFEQLALEKLQQGSDTIKPVQFLDLPVRTTAIVAFSITALGIFWSVFARVPVQVDGFGSIIPESQVTSAVAKTDGIVYFQVSGAGTTQIPNGQKRINRALSAFWSDAVVNNSELIPADQLIKLAHDAVLPVSSIRLVLPEEVDGTAAIDSLKKSTASYSSIFFKGNTIIARVDSPNAIDELDALRRITLPRLSYESVTSRDRSRIADEFVQITNLLSGQNPRLQQDLEDRTALYRRLEALWKKGYISTTQLLQENTQISAMINAKMQLTRDILASVASSKEQQNQARQSDLNMMQHKNSLQAGLVTYMSKAYTIAPSSGIHILSVGAPNGLQVRAGDEIFTYTIDKPTLPRTIPVFVDAEASQQLTEGMTALVTPQGISRSQYGGIPGVVVSVGSLALSRTGLASAAGGQTNANIISEEIKGAYLVQVRLSIIDAQYCKQRQSFRCYRWSGKRTPPFPVRIGTLADVQFNVRYRTPIEFVMPAVRKAIGLVVENR
jgi:hypothetical protein